MYSVAVALILGQVINGPKEIAADKSAVFSVAKSDAGADYQWSVPDGVMSFRSDTADLVQLVMLDLPTGEYTVVFVSFDKRSVNQSRLKVGTPKPPEPLPPPTPDPTLPELANAAKVWGVTHVSITYRPLASKLAASFRSVASAIAGGTLKDAASILSETKAANQTALGTGDARQAWLKWGELLRDELAKRDAAGTLRTPADYQRDWLEIAQGLEAVK